MEEFGRVRCLNVVARSLVVQEMTGKAMTIEEIRERIIEVLYRHNIVIGRERKTVEISI